MAQQIPPGLAGHRKQGSTYYTPERIAAGRRNVEKYGWARSQRDRILGSGGAAGSAGPFAAMSDEALWALQPSTRLPRAHVPGTWFNMCPVHGVAMQAHNSYYAWRLDALDHPYKLQCPVGKEWYPSNDYINGDMTGGEFPDDGGGILRDGKRYFVLREYAHRVYRDVVVPALGALSQAYLLSNDSRYAHKCAVLLTRLASEYPNYGWGGAEPEMEDRSERTFYGPWNFSDPQPPHAKGGLISNGIWECSYLITIGRAYDALFAAIEADAALLAFARGKGLNVTTADGLRQYIESYLLRAGAHALIADYIHANEGGSQRTAAELALLYDNFTDRRPNSIDLLDYAFFGRSGACNLVGCGIYPHGGGHESPFYNTSKFGLISVAQRMEDIRRLHPGCLPVERYPDIFANPRARAMFDYYVDMTICDGYLPLFGDTWPGEDRRAQPPVVLGAGSNMLFAAGRYEDPRFAAACLDGNGGVIGGSLWEAIPEERIRALAAEIGNRLPRECRLVDPYGVGILESGDFERRRAVALNYTNMIGHRQQDALSIELYARRAYIVQEPGYPTPFSFRWQWDAHSMAHNTVTVDETQPPMFSYNRPTGGYGITVLCVRAPGTGEANEPPAAGCNGRARLFACAGGVHALSASHDTYSGVVLGSRDARPVSIFERMLVMVDADEDRFYAIDLFSVDGGEQHDLSWHAFDAPVTPPDLAWVAQEGGTLAGPDVERFSAYTDRWQRNYPHGHAPSFMTGVRRARLAGPACWKWDDGKPGGDRLRLHIVPIGRPVEAIMAQGGTPARKDMEYLLVRKLNKKGALSRFLSVLDPSPGEPWVEGVRVIRAKPLTVEVRLAGQVHEIALNPHETPTASAAHRNAGVRVTVRKGGAISRDVRIGSVPGEDSPGWITAAVKAVEDAETGRPRLKVGFRGKSEPGAFGPGTWVRIFTDTRSFMYRVVERKDAGKASAWLTLDKTMLLTEAPLAEIKGGALVLDGHLLLHRDLTGAPITVGDWSGTVSMAHEDGRIEIENPPEAIAGAKPGTMVKIWAFAAGARIEAPVISTGRGTAP
ncbi:MAG: hypothetical protein GX608_09435 [Lentisphaerae bacterium]|nr:hypothetical protein [Lentisphaerota bacterium]